MDLSRNRWSYQALGNLTFSADAGALLESIPANLYEVQPTPIVSFDFWRNTFDDMGSQLATTVGYLVSFTNTAGRTIGDTAGGAVDDISGAIRIILPRGSIESGSAYDLPSDTYTIDLTAQQAGTGEFNLFGRGWLASFSSPTTPTETDTLRIDPLGTKIEYSTTSAGKNYQAAIFRVGQDATRGYEVHDARTALGQNSSIEIMPDNALRIANLGSTGSYYSLTLEMIGAVGGRFDRDAIYIGPNETHTISPTDWTNLSTSSVMISVDTNGDGTIDKTAVLARNDTVPPSTSATTVPKGNTAAWHNSDVTVNLSAADELGGSGVKTVNYSAAGAQPISTTTVPGSSATINVTTEGETALAYFATDNAGNTERTNTITVRVDKTAPTSSITSKPDSFVTNANAAFAFQGTDLAPSTGVAVSGIARLECQLDGGGFDPCSDGTNAAMSSVNYLGLARGPHTFQVRAVDVGGNTGTPENYSWRIDSPPTLGPVDPNSVLLGDTLTFTANGSDPDLTAGVGETLTYSLTNAPAGASIDPTSGVLTWTPTSAQVGVHNFSLVVTDKLDLADQKPVAVSVISKRATTLAYGGDTSVQYSDQVLLKAVLTDAVTKAGLQGKLVTFQVGTQSATAMTDSTGLATATIAITQSAASNTVMASFAEDGQYMASTDTKPFFITKEKAGTEYSGTIFALTSSMSATTAQVQLAAMLTEETDGSAGNLTEAKVSFELFKSSNTTTTPDQVISGIAVNADGTAQTTVSLGVDSWTVNVKIDSDNTYWTASPDGSSIVTVALPDPSRRVVGGGWIPYDGSANGKANFGFTVDYQKSGDPKGQSVFTFRSKDDGVNYVIKSNSWQRGGLGFATDATKATFSGKCVVQKVDPVTGAIVQSSGNYSYTVSLVDGDQANPKGTDKYAITIMDGSNKVWKQMGTANSPVQLGGGQVTVQSTNSNGATGSSTADLSTAEGTPSASVAPSPTGSPTPAKTTVASSPTPTGTPTATALPAQTAVPGGTPTSTPSPTPTATSTPSPIVDSKHTKK